MTNDYMNFIGNYFIDNNCDDNFKEQRSELSNKISHCDGVK